eukprot:scaffold143_cov110-Isochrysis_galbana.AAC.6
METGNRAAVSMCSFNRSRAARSPSAPPTRPPSAEAPSPAAAAASTTRARSYASDSRRSRAARDGSASRCALARRIRSLSDRGLE